ncbi:MAG: SLC13 family permease [Rubrivivax sp.]|nr:SLC13 family permease [Rubrivivax sp.]
MPSLPDPHALAVMLLTVVALVLFAQDRMRIETSALFVFSVLVLGLQVFPYQGDHGSVAVRELYSGFGHEALIAVCALMILGKGLETTGALQPAARLLARLWRLSPTLSLLATMLVAAVLSAFVNNTPIVVMLLPLLVGVTLSAKQSPAGVLMPFGLATVIGGTVTTIGTSTNLLVVSVARDMGVRPLGMFDFALPIVLVGGVGIIYLWLIAPRLLPQRNSPMSDQSARLFSAVFDVAEDSKIAGMTLAQVRKTTSSELRLLDIHRGNVQLVRLPSLLIKANDRLHVLDTPARLKALETELGVSLHGRDDDEPDENKTKPNGKTAADAAPAPAGDDKDKQRLVEIVVTEDSNLHGSSIRRERFADEFALIVLAIHRRTRHPEKRRDALADVELTAGDVLLAQGSAGAIEKLKSSRRGLLVLDSVVDLPDRSKMPLALAIMAAVVIAAATGVLPIAVAALIGVGAMLATRCMSWSEAMQGLSVPVVMIIVTSLALGTALIATGGAQYVAQIFVAMAGDLSPTMLLAALMLLMAVLTNVLSNNAAGIIGTPIAISIATQLGLDPVPFVVAIIAGVNLSFATPMAYQTNLLVMHAGGYRFMDFVKVGLPLTLLMLAGYTVVIPRFFPF